MIEEYEKQMDIRYGAARGFVDKIIAPDKTRETLGVLLSLLSHDQGLKHSFHTGVFQV